MSQKSLKVGLLFSIKEKRIQNQVSFFLFFTPNNLFFRTKIVYKASRTKTVYKHLSGTKIREFPPQYELNIFTSRWRWLAGFYENEIITHFDNTRRSSALRTVKRAEYKLFTFKTCILLLLSESDSRFLKLIFILVESNMPVCDGSGSSSSHKINLNSTEDDGLPSTSCCSIESRLRGACTTHQLKRRLPFLQWVCLCTVTSVIYDCLAGFTVALTAIPQGIAYAAVAGLPLEVKCSIHR